MKRIVGNSAVRVATSCIVLVAWLFVSNHCAFARLAGAEARSPAGHAHCPGHSAPTQKKNDGDAACCKALQPAHLAPTKNLVSYDASLFATPNALPVALNFPVRASPDLRPLELDTGPPLGWSFAESVLQRSVLAHAPPLPA